MSSKPTTVCYQTVLRFTVSVSAKFHKTSHLLIKMTPYIMTFRPITTNFNTNTLPVFWFWVFVTPMPDSDSEIERNVMVRMAFIDVWAHCRPLPRCCLPCGAGPPHLSDVIVSQIKERLQFLWSEHFVTPLMTESAHKLRFETLASMLYSIRE